MMKKKIVIALFFCLTATQEALAQQLTAEQSAQRVIEFLQQKNNSQLRLPQYAPMKPVISIADSLPGMFIFNIPGGFVIAPSAEEAYPVLGYVKGVSYEKQRMPEGMKAWIDYYVQTMSNVKYTGGTKQSARDPIAPMLKTQWGQSDPFNRFCPEVNGERCVSGCVATAIAQILYYYKQPTSSKAIYGYRTTTHKIQMKKLEPTNFDWADMCEIYNSSATDVSCNAVAKLMLYCGCAFAMDYSPDGSGADTTPVCDGIPYYFDYDESMRQVERDNYDDETWEELIYEQLKNGTPVLYSGRTLANSGHAFVCDGFENGLFHINWGWSGFCDSWFRLSLLQPYSADGEDSDYSASQKAIINFKPKGWTSNIISPESAISKSTKQIFSLTGMKIEGSPAKGLYVFKHGGIARKVLVK